ncbi:hypothetical protein QCA50_001147 [Cerrena zonata]|uniref:Uncharacterized protein n=1 Tax=Cerrena zonata TaxID=2478898 RepID=A0AAW0H0H6_9APHY
MPDPSEAGPSQVPPPESSPQPIPQPSQPDLSANSSVLQTYISIYHEHLTETQSHVIGRSKRRQGADYSCVLISSINWTREEKDLFFHGLCVHSRTRPDLIAQDIGTKSVVAVCAYIDELDEALAEVQEDEEYNDFWKRRRTTPMATEMSDRWCALEDRFASSIASVEGRLMTDVRTQTRRRVVKNMKRKFDKMDRDDAAEESVKSPSTFDEWQREQERIWKEEEFEMDRKMLRKVEIALHGKGKNRAEGDADDEGSDGAPEQGEEPVPMAQDDHPDPGIHPITGDEARPRILIDDSLIDPQLLAEPPPLPPKQPIANSEPPPSVPLSTNFSDEDDSSSSSSSSSSSDGEDDEDKDEDWETQTERSRKSSRRLRPKTLSSEERQQLETMGFDSDRLREAGVDVLRLQRLGKLMRMYRVSQDATKDVISGITLPAIKELAVLLKEFTREMVKASILSRQQERAAKGGARAWRHSQGPFVSVPNIQHALSLMGEKHLEHKQRWQHILKWYRSGGKSPHVPGVLPSSEKPSQDEDYSGNETLFEPTSSQVRTKGLSMYRTMRSPFVRLPTSLLPRPEVDFYQYAHPGRPSSPALPTPWALHSSSQEDFSEMESTDSEDLASELEEEDGLDESDMDLATSREKEMWALFGGDPTVDAGSRVEILQKGKKRKRTTSQADSVAQKKTKTKPRPKYRVRTNMTKVSKASSAAKAFKPPKPKPPKPKPPKPVTVQSSRRAYKSKEIISDSD